MQVSILLCKLKGDMASSVVFQIGHQVIQGNMLTTILCFTCKLCLNKQFIYQVGVKPYRCAARFFF